MLKKQEKWIIGVSGGPDSMALLDQCVQAKIPIIVAHVDYQKRATSKRDRILVEQYCRHHHVVFRCFKPKQKELGNFQAWARKARYTFFKSLVEQERAKGVYLAHQMDDHIETYLMQQERKIHPSFWGLRRKGYVDGVWVERPLLTKTKQQCLNYCKRHHVPYGIDETNLSNQYTRNRIRHSVVEKLTIKDKKELVQTIRQKNHEERETEKRIQKALKRNHIQRKIFRELGTADQVLLLRQYFLHNEILEKRSKDSFLKDLAKLVQSKKELDVVLRHTHLVSEKEEVFLLPLEPAPKPVTMKEPQALRTKWFKTSKQGTSLQACTLTKEDFPLTIRPPREGDEIVMRFGKKKIHRFFIDRKIPLYRRPFWPVVVNASQEVILVPELGSDKAHYSTKPTLFVIEYPLYRR